MEDPPADPYARSRYEHGIDSKIVIMGSSGVGKTSLLHRYTHNKFDPKNTTSTSGAFFVTKKVVVGGLKVRLQLWDTAGQERFRSMAPMYYRGANAALLMYDITNPSSFEDIRGWLQELKKNCSPDLLIYIVGSKADLWSHRKVTGDYARLSLHNWFPPPKPPTPPPPPPPSTLSYIRPRFTSFPSIRPPALNLPSTPTSPPISPETPAYLDLPHSRASAIARSKTSAQSRPRTTGATARTGSPGTRAAQSSRFGQSGPWNDHTDNSSNSIEEADEDTTDDWGFGLARGMELFEVSAKDDSGIRLLFDHLVAAIICRKDIIERENELKRESIFLSSSAPTWTEQAVAEEARSKGSWNCC